MSKTEWSWHEGWLPSGDTLAFDVENDFYELKAAKSKAETTVTQCAVSNGTDTFVARGEALTAMLNALCVYPGTLVGHNAWYADVPWIRATHPLFPFNQGETMALGYLMDETQPLSLKALCMKYLPDIEDWKEGIHAKQGSDEFAEYNATDALLTMRLYRTLSELLGERVHLVPKIIIPAMLALGACSERGIYLDKDAIGKADEFYRAKLSDATASLQVFGVDSPRKRALVGQALLADNHKLGTTETGKPSTSKATIARLRPTPLVEALKEFWSLDKAYSAYVKRYKKLSGTGDGRSHAPYTVIRTVTGRTSNSDQQLPRTPLLHAFFSAPPGFKYVGADYSAVEFRVAAWVAGERGIIQRYRDNPSFDPHWHFATNYLYKPEVIQTASVFALYAGLPTDRAGAEVLCPVLAAMGKGEQTREILANLHRQGWGRLGKLSPPANWAGQPLLEGWHSAVQALPQDKLRALFSNGYTFPWQGWAISDILAGASPGSQPTKQRSFQFDDALQTLSSARASCEAYEPEWSARRTIAKSAGFGFLYCAQPPTFVEYVKKTTGMGVTLEEATFVYKTWHAAHPAFKPWYGRTWDFLSEHGYVESVTGRRRHFVCTDPHPTGLDIKRSKPILKQPAWMRAAALREGVNFQVQSLAADIALIALHKCYQEGLPVNGFVHDSVTFEVEEGVDLTEKLQKYMVRYPPYYLRKHFGVNFDMPLQIEVK